MGGGDSGNNQQPAATGMPIQTSAYGLPVALLWGQTRLAPNLLEYENFRSEAGGQGGKGGKGGMMGGGGKGGAGDGTYNYFVDLAIGLCEGPIAGVAHSWISQTISTFSADGWTLFTGTIPQAVWKTESYSGLAYGAQLQYALGQTNSLPNFNFEVASQFAGYTLTYIGDAKADWGFMMKAIASGHLTMFEGLGALTGSGRATSTALPGAVPDSDPSFMMTDFLTNPNYGVGFPASRVGGVQLENEARTIPTTPFQITVTKAAAYAWNVNIARDSDGFLFTCVAAAPATGQYTFNSTTGVYTFAAADAGVALHIRYVTYTGLADFQAFTIASGLWNSPAYDSQTSANSIMDDMMVACYSTVVWASGVMNIVPLGSVTVTGNGFTWTAPSAPLFSLTDDDFVDPNGPSASTNGGDATDPLLITRSRTADQNNVLTIEYLDRSAQYAPAIVAVADQAHIDTFGIRPPVAATLHMITNATTANICAQLNLQRQSLRNSYSFSTDPRFCVLDPMDLIAVTDTNQDVVAQWVRIGEMTENDDSTYSFIAEEFPYGTGAAATYSLQIGSGYAPNYNLDPGPVNAPEVFAAPPQLARNQGLELAVALSGASTVWGGCYIYVSSDDTTYAFVGNQYGPTRMGVTTNDFPVTPDPTRIYSIDINLTMSFGEVLGGTQADADAGNTTCLVRGPHGDEYVAYQDATLLATYKYELGAYIRRGLYQTPIVDHPADSPFIRVDNSLFLMPYKASDIGNTIFLKFCSFNLWQGGVEAIDSVTAYELVIPEPPPPPDVTNFMVQQVDAAVVFRWQAVDYPLLALAGYYIGYAPLGTTDWSLFIMLTKAQGGYGTEMTNADVPPGTWTFAIRAASIANTTGNTIGLSAHMATADLVVVETHQLISAVEEAPGWPGTLDGFVQSEVAGALVPASIYPVSHYVTLAPPPAPVLSSVVSGLALTFTAFVKITYVTATGETIVSAEASQAITSGHSFKVTSPAAYGNATGYNVYAATSTGAETQQNGLPINIGTDWTQSIAIFAGAPIPDHNSTGGEPFDVFVPDPVPSANYIAPLIDVGYDEQVRVFFTSAGAKGPRQTGSMTGQLTYALDHWLAAASDPNVFTAWTSSTVTARYMRGQLNYPTITPGQVAYVTDFTPSVEQVATSPTGTATIAAAGTRVNFGQTFNAVPVVQVTYIGAGGLYATATAIDTTGFTAHVWNAGADVGGDINWTATGE